MSNTTTTAANDRTTIDQRAELMYRQRYAKWGATNARNTLALSSLATLTLAVTTAMAGVGIWSATVHGDRLAIVAILLLSPWVICATALGGVSVPYAAQDYAEARILSREIDAEVERFNAEGKVRS